MTTAETCPSCFGQKTYSCPSCHGHGCSLCDSHEFPCVKCEGRGSVTPRDEGLEYARLDSVIRRFPTDKQPCWAGCGTLVIVRTESTGVKQIDRHANWHSCPNPRSGQ